MPVSKLKVAPALGKLLQAIRRKAFGLGNRRIAQEHQLVLAKVREQLGATMRDMEGNFLNVAERMEMMDTCSHRLIEKCENLIYMASGSEEGEKLLRDSLEILKGPLEYIDFCAEQNQRLLELLAQCENQTRGMLNIRSRMHDAIAPLTFMAVMFKIESAYLPDEHRETFLTVTAEVERLHRLVDETFTHNAAQLEDAHATLAAVRARLEADFRAQAKHIAAKRSNIDKAILTLDQQLSKNTERDVKLHDQGAMLASEVSRIVMGIQFQDIVKQKCDHVIEALAIKPADEAEWAHSLALQVRQLNSVQSDLSEGCSAIQAGLGRIEQYTDQLGTSSVSLENIESMTAAMDGMVQLLLDTLSDVNDIIRMVAELTEQGYTAVKPASGLARNLTETIVELSINMQLIALNAQVRSVQSGQGTGLELLAARTAEVSMEIDGISSQISHDLSELHEAIDQMLKLFDQFRTRGTSELSGLATHRGPAETRLHALRDRTIMAVQEIGVEIDSLLASVKEVHGSLDGMGAFVEDLSGLMQYLEQSKPEHHHSHGAVSTVLSGMLNRYTMASERAVHEEFLAEVAKGKASQAIPSAVPEQVEVNRSGASPANATSVVATTAAPAAPAAAPAPASQPPSRPQPAASGLGDNVELF